MGVKQDAPHKPKPTPQAQASNLSRAHFVGAPANSGVQIPTPNWQTTSGSRCGKTERAAGNDVPGQIPRPFVQGTRGFPRQSA